MTSTNTETFAKWVELHPSKINDIRLKQLLELDDKCQLCMKGAEMLCNGYRLTGTPTGNVELTACERLESSIDQEDWKRRALFANLGKKKIQTIQDLDNSPHYPLDVEFSKGRFRNELGRVYPDSGRFQFSTKSTDYVKQHMLNFVDCGFQPRYLFTIQLYQDETLLDKDVLFQDQRLIEEMSKIVVDPDWVHIDAVDYQGSPRIRQTMLKCLRLRIDEMKMTTVSYTCLDPKTDLEDNIYQDITKWELITP